MREIAPRSPATAHSPTEGELWAQQALRELRHGKFAPAAWITFLRASFARAQLRRRQRQQAHREVMALGGAGLVGWIAVGLAGRPALAALGAGWWLLASLMLDWHLGMLERPDGRPLQGLGVANRLTLVRAGVVPLLAVLPPIALAALLLAAGASDVLDGWLARRLDQVSRLGLWLDGSVDGFVLAVAAAAEARSHLLPGWAAAAVLARYLLPWIVVAFAYFVRAEAPRSDNYLRGRVPGMLVLGGIALAALRVPAASLVVVAGAGGGIFTVAVSIARVLTARRPRLESKPLGQSRPKRTN
jgi:cardiolipin synthase